MRKYSGFLLIGLATFTLAACSSNEETIEVSKPDMGDTRIDLTSGQVMEDGQHSYGTGEGRVLSSMSTSNVEIFSLDGPAGGRMSGPRSSNYTAPSFGGVGNKSVEITGIGQPSTPSASVGTLNSYNDDYDSKKNSRIKAATPKSLDLLGTVYFDHSSSSLTSADMQTIETAARSFSTSGGAMLSVEGHSSMRAATENPITRKRTNLDVSTKRAAAVAKALISFGIPGNKIKTVAWGEEHPANINDGMSEESASRRVEILSVSGQ